jgi:predicted transglutaminase-like cysteine proteinase
MSTESTHRSAVHSGVGFWKSVTWATFLVAGAISMLDPLELFSYSVTPVCFTAAEYVGPNVNAAMAPPGASTATDKQSDQLFGTNTEPVTAGRLFDKWRDARAGIAQDLAIAARCEANEPCSGAAQQLIGLSREGAGRNERARIGLINRAVDLAISPVSDEAQWGVADRWSDPLETLRSDRGDCEDYAIVKYAALLKAGLSKDDVKIVVFRNRKSSEDHAVVAAHVDHQWLLLDNQTLTLVRDRDVMRATPEFVLGEDGARRFVWNGGDRGPAS